MLILTEMMVMLTGQKLWALRGSVKILFEPVSVLYGGSFYKLLIRVKVVMIKVIIYKHSLFRNVGNLEMVPQLGRVSEREGLKRFAWCLTIKICCSLLINVFLFLLNLIITTCCQKW